MALIKTTSTTRTTRLTSKASSTDKMMRSTIARGTIAGDTTITMLRIRRHTRQDTSRVIAETMTRIAAVCMAGTSTVETTEMFLGKASTEPTIRALVRDGKME